MQKVVIYTDGACKGNPGRGGWGAFLQSGGHTKELCGGESHTTNNRMEMMAAVMALRELTAPCEVLFFLDSQYVRKGLTEWLPNWKARNWRTSTGAPVKNKELWQELDSLLENTEHTITWRWVKGHSGDVGNERADMLANHGVELHT